MESYQGNTDKIALNMGIYASDISYLAAYGLEEECIKYLETSHAMAEELGDSAIYDQSHLDEFRGHVKDENEEEISRLLAKLFMETSIQMEKRSSSYDGRFGIDRIFCRRSIPSSDHP